MIDETKCQREVVKMDVRPMPVSSYPSGFCYENIRRELCNKPKNPEFLYCEDCIHEVFDEKLAS